MNREILLKYCNPIQARNVNAYFDNDNNARKAAETLNINSSVISRTISRARKRAADDGIVEGLPLLTIAEGRKLGKVTTQITGDGEVKNVWYRQDDQLELAKVAIDEFCKEQPPIKSKTPKQLEPYCTDVIPWFNIGDGHLGMISYHEEVGEAFDLSIAERELCAAMGILIDEAPVTERCVIQDMGDMTHYENSAGKTSHSGHDLDCDGRFAKMIKVYARTMRFIMDKAVAKYKYVDVIINQGNHSRINDFWMVTLLQHLYEDNDQVTILNNDNVFTPYRMGNTFVMTHHSDKCRPNKLVDVMSTDYRQDFGEAKYKYIDIGHIHHSMVLKEHPGVTLESFNQLATRDQYAHDGGWRSSSCLTVVYRSKTYGEIGRNKLSLERVRDVIDNAKAGTNCNIRPTVHSV
jgi:hypothetical protein